MPYKEITRGAGKRMMEEILIGTLSVEILYSFIIVICSLMIFFGTKELYKLSGHKGIKYFRLAFLYFAIAYFFRSFIKIIIVCFGMDGFRSFGFLFGAASSFLFMYFSIMAIFYLLYSVLYKKLKRDYIKVFHVGLLVLTFVVIGFGNNIKLILLANILLLLFIVYIVYLAYMQSKKKKSLNLYIVYFLLSIFWMLNIIDILIPDFLRAFQLLIYLMSLGVFLVILYKVLTRAGVN